MHRTHPTHRGRGLAPRPIVAALTAASLVVGCAGESEPDAYGNVEATQVVVGAETGGQLLWFAPAEGQRLPADTVVALIDTTQLALQGERLAAQQAGSASRVREVIQQIDVLEVQRRIAQQAYERTRRLHAQQAATIQQLEQAEREYRVLEEQIEAARAQRQTVGQDVAATEAEAAQLRDQIAKSLIRNPVAGTVLTVYARAGEFLQVGQPLYSIADLDTVDVRAYVTETQLGRVRLGQQVRVTVDVGADERRSVPGMVTWVSSQAEFTPTPIQTREERADLVYALEIRVPNGDGLLKIGMPVDVQFAAGADAAPPSDTGAR